MNGPLLTTKLHIPRVLPSLVPRPRLIERLNEGPRLDRKLTLVSAPAGFGKTTVVSEWVDAARRAPSTEDAMHAAAPPTAIAWVTLDEADNDPRRFLTYVVAALNRIDGLEGAIGEGAVSILTASKMQTPPAEAILTSLINDIAAISGRIVLILDDYHSVAMSQANDMLNFLLERLPPQMHLVIATRDDPHLPLARLRARGQLTELRAADLRFTSSEAADFLNRAMGLELSAEDIAALEKRTEGWIAGLQLAAISIRGRKDAAGLIRSFTGSHRFVLDYLIEEVLDRQTESVQRFLLRTAVLDRFTGALCDALTGQDSGRVTLEMLERTNLFIVPLDDERRWYRYHQLFADLLRQRLRQLEPEHVAQLHKRASEWHERNGFLAEAIEHALRAGDFQRAAVLVGAQFNAMYQRGEHIKLRSWLAALPDELVFSKPQLSIPHAWSLFSSGQLDAAEQSLQAAELALNVDSGRADETSSTLGCQPTATDAAQLQGQIAAMRAFLASYRGDVRGTILYACQALDDLPPSAFTWRSTAAIALGDAYDIKGDMVAAYQARSSAVVTSEAAGDAYLLTIANLKIATTLRMQGHLQQVLEICKRQMSLAQESGIAQTVVAGWLLAIWGEALAELNALDQAKHRATEGLELAGRGKDVAMLGWSSLCLLRVLFSRREFSAAEQIIYHMERTARDAQVPPWIMNVLAAWQVRIWLAQGQLDRASRWSLEHKLDPKASPYHLHDAEDIALARILIAQGRLDETEEILGRLLASAQAGGRTAKAIEILVLQALARQVEGDMDKAISALEQALTLAESGGFVRVFVDEGPAAARLLYEVVTRGAASDYARRLLAAFPTSGSHETQDSRAQAAPSELIEPLSEREVEVLHLIADGLTNAEIAGQLYLSLNTIKTHTRNIYEKLNVHSRTQAVARSQELGLLPPRRL